MTVEIKIPSPGESVVEAEISDWLKDDGAYVEVDEPLFELESDKAALTVASDTEGVLKILVEVGETVAVGSVACTIEPATKPKEVVVAATGVSGDLAATPGPSAGKPYPSVAAAKIMRERGVAADDVVGSGREGRITKDDAQRASQKSSTQQPAAKADVKKAAASTAAVPKGQRAITREPLSRLRQKLAERLVSVKNETAMLTTFNEIDMSAIIAFRSRHKEAFQKRHGVKLGYMSLFTKACAEALTLFPKVNAQIDGSDMLVHSYCDIGIAVAAPKGLMVPVVRNAEAATVAEIEQTIFALATKARAGKLSLDEMTAGTFTITNGGVFGSLMSTPIINPPQSAILGMHNIVERPVAVDGQVVVRPMMYVAVSYDHRIIDGAESVQFLVKIKEFIEDPARMLLGL